MSEADDIKADIEATRAELVETADALVAKLDVKAHAADKLHAAQDKATEKASAVGEKVVGGLHRARDAAPEPVQRAVDTAVHKAGDVGGPVVAKAVADKKRAALIAVGVVAAVLIIRRVRK